MGNLDVRVLDINRARDGGWDDMVANHPLGTVFHHTTFGELIACTLGHVTPYYLALSDNNGVCRGGAVFFLIKSWLTGSRLVSIPYACYGDPLIRSKEELAMLLPRIVAFADEKEVSYVEIRTRATTAFFEQTHAMTSIQPHKSHFLDLTQGLETIWAGLHKTRVREPIRRAERNGIEVRMAASEQEVMSFYRVFFEHRRQLGLPPQQPKYFQNIWRYAASRGLAHFPLAYLQNELVGGLCCFSCADKLFWSYVGIAESVRRVGVAQLLPWTMIRAASKRGVRIFDFGKIPSSAEALLCYKRSWGVEETDVPVFYYPKPRGITMCDDERQLSYRAMRYFWKTAPRFVSRAAGKFFCRHA